MGHAPWAQYQVYRQIHMLVMCSKLDNGAYDFTKQVIVLLGEYLPDAKARVARAKNEERIINLLSTDQIPLAILSYDLLKKITNNKKTRTYFLENTKIIFTFSNMILLSDINFSSVKAEKVYLALIKAGEKIKYNELKFTKQNDLLIPYHEIIEKRLNK